MIAWGEFMPWCRRRTPGWQALSFEARGAVEAIATALNDRGELSIGRLAPEQALAALSARPLAEATRAWEELRAAKVFEHDEARGVLIDPQHVERQERAAEALRAFLAAEPALSAPSRRRSSTPAADRAAAYRARKKANAGRQLSLPDHVRPRDERDANVTRHAERHASRDEVAPTLATSEDLAAKWELPPCDASRDAAPSSLSDLISDHEVKTERAPVTRSPNVTLDPSAMPPEFARVAADRRPELASEDVAASWASFADANSGKWRSTNALLGRWRAWIGRERGSAPTPVHAPASRANAQPKPRLARTEVAPTARFSRWEAELASAKPDEMEIARQLAAQLAAGELARARELGAQLRRAS